MFYRLFLWLEDPVDEDATRRIEPDSQPGSGEAGPTPRWMSLWFDLVVVAILAGGIAIAMWAHAH